MKKMFVILLSMLCLTGCNASETMETISDDLAISAGAVAADITLVLDDEEAAMFCGADGSKLYVCDEYSVMVQTSAGGDIAGSIQAATGFSKDKLTVMQTRKHDVTSYEYAWSTTGEAEDQICRGVLLDDGAYHYAVTIMADYTQASSLQDTWQSILDSVMLSID